MHTKKSRENKKCQKSLLKITRQSETRQYLFTFKGNGVQIVPLIYSGVFGHNSSSQKVSKNHACRHVDVKKDKKPIWT